MSLQPLRILKAPLPAALSLVALLAALLATGGCADMATDLGWRKAAEPAPPPKETRMAPVTSAGRSAAVLSVHTKKEYENACKYGLTLTNNLPDMIKSLSFRLTAIIDGKVPFDSQTKSFSDLRPSEQQYRELVFQGIRCTQIGQIEVSDPGRCTIGDLNRFNAAPGDCAKFSELAAGGVVLLARKQ